MGRGRGGSGGGSLEVRRWRLGRWELGGAAAETRPFSLLLYLLPHPQLGNSSRHGCPSPPPFARPSLAEVRSGGGARCGGSTRARFGAAGRRRAQAAPVVWIFARIWSCGGGLVRRRRGSGGRARAPVWSGGAPASPSCGDGEF
ncbi:unnamed protein product [Urochloa humidicola]